MRPSQMPKQPEAPPADWIAVTLIVLVGFVAALWCASLLIAAGDQAGAALAAVFHVMTGTR